MRQDAVGGAVVAVRVGVADARGVVVVVVRPGVGVVEVCVVDVLVVAGTVRVGATLDGGAGSAEEMVAWLGAGTNRVGAGAAVGAAGPWPTAHPESNAAMVSAAARCALLMPSPCRFVLTG